ncbi:hypothetical protein HYU07_02735 [Candidatus Woesearchaeota archaeon]|nr:hypothetical protein [Candidatus Woesearchaeota archaeon]
MIIRKVVETIDDLSKGKEYKERWATRLEEITKSDGDLYKPFTEGRPATKEDFEKIEKYGLCKVEIVALYWDIVADGFMAWKQKESSVNNGEEALKFLENMINNEMKILFQGKTTIKDTPFIITYGREVNNIKYTELETRGGRPLGVMGHYSIFIKPNSN